MAEVGWCKATGPQGFHSRHVVKVQVLNFGSVAGSTADVLPVPGFRRGADDRY